MTGSIGPEAFESGIFQKNAFGSGVFQSEVFESGVFLEAIFSETPIVIGDFNVPVFHLNGLI
ncbi:MAG: hypothetical protein QNJ46_05880 [Leptolyngbyaceae cyanobacterium MO_188.B28]|nr:hypothetical protein [Leptolyngbyaceae cyanobacterium MO_188.B28]